MKYFLIAGEASGDLHGSNLIRAIKAIDSDSTFQFWGGDKMAQSANGLLKHYKEVTIMGFIEVVMNLRKIKSNLALCEQQILAFSPDVVICIDYPGFNLRMAAFCKQHQIPVHYYIAPKVWAWKENRAKLLEKYVDELILVFPFEVDYFKKWKVKATYVGNPLCDELIQYQYTANGSEGNIEHDRKVIALLPGSRKQEISKTLPIMLEALSVFTDYDLVIAGSPGIDKSYYQPYLNDHCRIVYDETYQLLSKATLAIVCSGTATLETALFNVPQVCVYMANPISYFIAKLLVRIKYISLVNLCLNKTAIRELIQNDFNVDELRLEAKRLLEENDYRSKQLADYKTLQQLLGGEGASKKAASLIVHALQ